MHPIADRSLSFSKTAIASPPENFRADPGRCWKEAETREMLERVMRNGFFAGERELADSFLAKIEAMFTAKPISDSWRELREFLLNSAPAQTLLNQDGAARIARRVEQLIAYLPAEPTSLMDLGNGNGLITAGLARALRLPRDAVVGLDCVPRAEESADYTQLYYEPSADGSSVLPVDGREFDCITMLMLLHHLEHPRAALQQAFQVLRPGGRVLIRETDASTENLRNFNAVMEEFYYRVFNEHPDIPVPNYHLPAEYWVETLKQIGYRIEKAFAVEDENPFTPFYVLAGK